MDETMWTPKKINAKQWFGEIFLLLVLWSHHAVSQDFINIREDMFGTDR